MNVPKAPASRYKARTQRVGSFNHPYKGITQKLARPKLETLKSDTDADKLEDTAPVRKKSGLKKLSPGPSQFKKLSRKF